jgi:hypothetical protein
MIGAVGHELSVTFPVGFLSDPLHVGLKKVHRDQRPALLVIHKGLVNQGLRWAPAEKRSLMDISWSNLGCAQEISPAWDFHTLGEMKIPQHDQTMFRVPGPRKTWAEPNWGPQNPIPLCIMENTPQKLYFSVRFPYVWGPYRGIYYVEAGLGAESRRVLGRLTGNADQVRWMQRPVDWIERQKPGCELLLLVCLWFYGYWIGWWFFSIGE